MLRGVQTSRVLVAGAGKSLVATLRLATKKPWGIGPAYFQQVSRALYLSDMAIEPKLREVRLPGGRSGGLSQDAAHLLRAPPLMPPPDSAATLGLRVKSGWAAAVLMGGSSAAPVVLHQRRIELGDPQTPHSLQPYHAGTGRPQMDHRVVARLVGLIVRCAHESMAALVAGYHQAGWRPARALVVGTSATDPQTITNPHIRIHALEGQLFRRVTREALIAQGINAIDVLEQSLEAQAPKQLDISPAGLRRKLTELKPPGEGPWRAEQKIAALAAWSLLAP